MICLGSNAQAYLRYRSKHHPTVLTTQTSAVGARAARLTKSLKARANESRQPHDPCLNQASDVLYFRPYQGQQTTVAQGICSLPRITIECHHHHAAEPVVQLSRGCCTNSTVIVPSLVTKLVTDALQRSRCGPAIMIVHLAGTLSGREN